MVLSQAQMSAMSASRIERFARECRLFIEQNAPQWCESHRDEEKSDLIQSMIELGEACYLSLEESVRQLMLYKIEVDFDLPLTTLQKDKLSQRELSESYRLAQFYQLITADNNKNELIKITLDDMPINQGQATG